MKTYVDRRNFLTGAAAGGIGMSMPALPGVAYGAGGDGVGTKLKVTNIEML